MVARDGERPIDLEAYAARSSPATSAGTDVTAAFEPGDLVMKDAAVLLGEVVTVERRGDTTFVGLDIGWNVNCSYFIYKYAQEIVPVRSPMRARTAASRSPGTSTRRATCSRRTTRSRTSRRARWSRS